MSPAAPPEIVTRSYTRTCPYFDCPTVDPHDHRICLACLALEGDAAACRRCPRRRGMRPMESRVGLRTGLRRS